MDLLLVKSENNLLDRVQSNATKHLLQMIPHLIIKGTMITGNGQQGNNDCLFERHHENFCM